jgi:CDP-diacylglycerol--glycerol-3-phosphate 3-phosphatidyltransferase
MASIYDLKPRFQTLLRPLVHNLAKAGVTANQVTVAAVILSFVVGVAIAAKPSARWRLGMLPMALFLRMALNAIDGMLAREHHMKSSLGAILNELGDVVSDVALYLPLALVPGITARWVVVVVILAMLSEMAGVIALQVGAQRRYDGPMGKSDRAFVFGLFGLLMAVDWLAPSNFNYVLIVVAILLGATVLRRARRAMAEAR